MKYEVPYKLLRRFTKVIIDGENCAYNCPYNVYSIDTGTAFCNLFNEYVGADIRCKKCLESFKKESR